MGFPLVHRMQGFGSTIFAEMTALATEHGAVNLGQGFPDTDGPREMLEAAKAAIDGGRNQYPPGPGVPELLDAVAVPYYDSYAASIALAGAVRRTSVLRFPDFAVDEASLRAAFSERTRMVLLNTPHNPTGKVFSRAELDVICSLAREFDAWVVTDEVYEHLTFDGAEHVPVATLPGMWERTLTISSAGKTFSATGWKVGWVSGPAEAVAAVRAVKQFLTFVGSGPFQPAVAVALEDQPAVHLGVLTTCMPGWRRRSRASATCSSKGCAPQDWRCRCRRARTSWWPTPHRSARWTR